MTDRRSAPGPLTDEQLDRYARHIILKEVGGAGQAKLLRARVLVIGAGGLGSPVVLYLAAAGVGTIGVIDDDVVSLSNLQRQVAHQTGAIGRPKTDSIAETVARLNPDVRVIRHPERLVEDNAVDLIGGYDIVADGSDNFATRFLVNDTCYFTRKPLVSAALGQFEGQLSTFKAHVDGPGGHGPCYRCLFPMPPPEASIPSCAEAGILGAVAGVMGSLQATEVLKEILGIGQSLSGRLMIYQALDAAFRTVRVKADPACPLCGLDPSIDGPAATRKRIRAVAS